MTGKKVVFPAFTTATLGAMLFVNGCQGEASFGTPKTPEPPASTVAAVPTPAPTPTPPPVDTPPPAPPPKQVKLKGVSNMKGTQIELPGDIEFASNSDKFNEKEPKTNTVLTTVLQIMTDNPNVTMLRVEGHTDNEGGNGINKPLSDKRAAAVVNWLVAKGVDKSRLHSVGFGADCPLAANDTAANKKLNRRTEFHLESLDNKPLDGDAHDAKGCSVAAGAGASGGGSPTPASTTPPAASGAVGGGTPKPTPSATPPKSK